MQVGWATQMMLRMLCRLAVMELAWVRTRPPHMGAAGAVPTSR